MVDHVHDLAYTDVPVFSAEAVKGLEFDGVVVVNAHQIFEVRHSAHDCSTWP